MRRTIAFRRCILMLLSSFCLLKVAFTQARAGASLRWVNATGLSVEGRGFDGKTEHFYDRLPASAKGRVRDAIWTLGQDSSGMAVPFITDSGTIYVRWQVRKPILAMSHMPATGVSGLDLYMRDGSGNWRWASAGRPADSGTVFTARLIGGLSAAPREFLLYLPLYNGTDVLEIGIDSAATIEPIVREEKPIVFYGTSITQGACASRPGMSYAAILGRRLNRPIINLGFSGNGRMEPEAMVDIAGLQTPSVFVIDTLPNMQPTDFDRYTAGIALIRQKHPQVPLILVSSIEYPGSWVNASVKHRHQASNENLRAFYQKLSATDDNVYLVEPEGLLGTDEESTVDGTHPNDLGFVRIADHIEPVLRQALNR